jgi:hypothetical protein
MRRIEDFETKNPIDEQGGSLVYGKKEKFFFILETWQMGFFKAESKKERKWTACEVEEETGVGAQNCKKTPKTYHVFKAQRCL